MDTALTAKALCALAHDLTVSGAETRLIVQSVKEVAADWQVPDLALGVTSTGITVQAGQGADSCCCFAEVKEIGINMSAVRALHRLCLTVKSGELSDPSVFLQRLQELKSQPQGYDQRLIVLLESIAAGAFAYLNGGGLKCALAAMLGGLLLMLLRLIMLRRGFFSSFVFVVAAFGGSLTAAALGRLGFNMPPEDCALAATCCTLLLVPGFPLMNGFLDVFKGYVDIGINRLFRGSVLIICAAIGLIGTLYLIYLPLWEGI